MLNMQERLVPFESLRVTGWYLFAAKFDDVALDHGVQQRAVFSAK